MSWACFHVVMSSSKFAHTRIGYYVASQSFHNDTPMLLLITNQFRKDRSSINHFEVSLTHDFLSRIATLDLARDLTPKVFKLLSTTRVFAKLAPLEPRLGKIVEPVCDHMRRSGAQALVFKCVRTVLTSLSDYHSAIRLVVEKARDLLVDQDPNLRYLGL
ncbi:hypothetical protein JHK87_016327 [Glycine soja]|nr:hypothetical protein JHK87_016327 [Glycine soja]